MRILLALTTLLIAGCATTAPEQVTGWQVVATQADRQRLRDWRGAFTKALGQARAAGHAADIAREGKLLDPDAALGPVPIPNGRYKCRVIKIGAKTPGMLDFITYPAFDCRIQQERLLQSLYKLTGSQRHTGLIFPGDPLRQVLLGTMVLGDESRAMQYGRDKERDIAGWIERIDDRRWRLVLPYPHYESTLDVVELIPEQ
jgi:hypothetical protein